MTCVKTGCHIYIIPYGTFAYGYEGRDINLFPYVKGL